MRFHVVSLPHTQTTEAFVACAFTEKVRKFCDMMHKLGHTVYLYAGEQNEARCTEHIPCISEDARAAAVGGNHYTAASFDTSLPHWVAFNTKAAVEIGKRIQQRDYICVIGGLAHKPVATAFPNHITVEFGVGYGGVFADFKVFESYAWMHTVYGSHKPYDPCAVDGTWYDAVIPGYLEPEKFPFGAKKGDYFLFVGRLIERKGFNVAVEMCRRLGARLVIAGQGTPPDYGEYVGVVGPEERGRLMVGARALIAPTVYVEPFGNVAVEAMACGTPVISTDWGAFTETVVPGVTGFRCRTLAEFVDAGGRVAELDYAAIRRRALDKYSVDVIALEYERYFERLGSLWAGGWYQ